MGSGSLGHWLVVAVVVLIVFGAGRLPKTMTDLAKGVRAFKTGLRNDDLEPVLRTTPAAASPAEPPPVRQA